MNEAVKNFFKRYLRLIVAYIIIEIIFSIINYYTKNVYGYGNTILYTSLIFIILITIENFRPRIYFTFKFISSGIVDKYIELRGFLNRFYLGYLYLYYFLLLIVIIILYYNINYTNSLGGIYINFSSIKKTASALYYYPNQSLNLILLLLFTIKYNFKLINGIVLYILGIFFISLISLSTNYPNIINNEFVPILLIFTVIYLYAFLFKNGIFSPFKESNSRKLYHFNGQEKIFISTKNQLELQLESNNKKHPKSTNTLIDKYKKHYSLFIEKMSKDYPTGKFIVPLIDNPINIGEDILGFENSAQNLYDLLNGINTDKIENSYSVGIVGEWGLGKTSLINLLEQEHISGNSNFLIYKFSPWNYEKKELVEKFFLDLGKTIGKRDFSKLFLKYLDAIGLIHEKLKSITSIFRLFFLDKTLEEIKIEISDNISELNKRIIIIIDDLDRCEPDEVIITLNLIKNLGSFKNVIYLVSYDKLHIIEILEKKGFDKDYLEKIINIESFVPAPNITELNKFFNGKLKLVLSNVGIVDKIIEDSILKINRKYNKIIQIENMRFIKKLLNQLDILFQLKNKTDKDYIKKLVSDDIDNIFFINYIKLKDVNFYTEAIKISKYILETQNSIDYDGEDTPKCLKSIDNKFLYKDFLGFNGIQISESNKIRWLGEIPGHISFGRQEKNTKLLDYFG